MVEIIDIHNHLLPGIDDGAPDIASSIAMARIAIDQGITHIVCTPHIHPGRFDNTPQTIIEALAIFRNALSDNNIHLKVATSAEIHFSLELMGFVDSATLPYLGVWQGQKVLLLEFPHGEIPFAAERLTSWLLERNVVPMIAHPERNRRFIQNPGLLKTFLNQGCLLQITASSFTGRFGKGAQILAEHLLAENVITVIASDAHDALVRPPVFDDAVKRIQALSSQKMVTDLVSINPGKMVESLF